MSEGNLHRCVRENKIQAGDLEKISSVLGVPVGYFFDEVTEIEQTRQAGRDNYEHSTHTSGDAASSAILKAERDAARAEVAALREVIVSKDQLIATLQKLANNLQTPNPHP